MGENRIRKSSHTSHPSHREECYVCDDFAGTQEGKEESLLQCHPGCTQNMEYGGDIAKWAEPVIGAVEHYASIMVVLNKIEEDDQLSLRAMFGRGTLWDSVGD